MSDFFSSIQIMQAPLLGNAIIAFRPDLIACGPVQYAMICAHIKYQGRDRRRIKREVNKAARKVRRQRSEA